MEQWFENQVAMVNGGSSGIGHATALAFAARGASVDIFKLFCDEAGRGNFGHKRTFQGLA